MFLPISPVLTLSTNPHPLLSASQRRAAVVARRLLPAALVSTAFLICSHAQHADPHAREQEVIRELDRAQARREADLGGYSVTEYYTVHNSRFNTAAEIEVHANFTRDAGKTYRVTSSSGSSLLQTRVLDKLLKEEAEMSHGILWQQSRVISANYRMRLFGEEVVEGHPCDVLELVPLVKGPHVLKGRAWVNAKNHLLVKIEGRPSTSPSFLAGRPMIVREYENIDGFAFAKRTHAISDSLLLGRTELTILYSGFKLTHGL